MEREAVTLSLGPSSVPGPTRNSVTVEPTRVPVDLESSRGWVWGGERGGGGRGSGGSVDGHS